MSVLIKGMEMPTSCGECKAFVCYKQWAGDRGDCFCGITKSDCKAGAQNADCPLVHVPPHGRLIDADALINTLQELFDKRAREAEFGGNRGACVTWNDAIYHIKSAPTIIPAEEGE